VTVQRRVSATGRITVCRQQVSLGRVHAGRIVGVHVAEHTLAIELDDETKSVRRTTTKPPRVLKASRPHGAGRQDARPALAAPTGPATAPPPQSRS
jgi:hypothetical protein